MTGGIIPGASVRDIKSRSGDIYRIFIWHPSTEPGPEGFPVLYLLDGNVTFPIAAVSVALQSRRPETTGVQPAVVIGIGYPTEDWLDGDRRTYDYTPQVARDELPTRPNNTSWPRTGGADGFLDFLQSELRPLIEKEFKADGPRSAIFGHSFGGLLVLYALFTRMALFKSYVAASPSIWFGTDALHTQMKKFMANSAAIDTRNLLVTVGSLEQQDASAGHDIIARPPPRVVRNRMVENARDLAASLAAMDARRLRVVFKEFEDENHASVLPAAISRALRFSLATV